MVDAKFQTSSERIAKELSKLKGHKAVSKAKQQFEHCGLNRPVKERQPLPTVRIGVCFRTDGSGKVHGGHDVKGLMAINDLVPGPGCHVTCIALPRGASGGTTPTRNADCSLDELNGIDLLYVPGAPAAPVSQTATSVDPARALEEANFNRKSDPGDLRPEGKKKGEEFDKAKREFIEFASRAPYEARLINIARVRGIPVLAICAGSWRLVESYGGKVRTLPIEGPGPKVAVRERDKHKTTSTSAEAVWGLSHGVNMKGQTMVGDRGGHLSTINSTHWAVACTRYNVKRKELGLAPIDPGGADPDKMLEISAFCDDPLSATVEAFETRFGAPQIGIQWHPETYMPGMLGEKQGSAGGRIHAQRLFLFIVGAALTAHRRKAGIAKELSVECRAFRVLVDAARAAGQSRYGIAAGLFKEAQLMLAREAWSGRMEVIAEAISLIVDADDDMVQGRVMPAAFKMREAQAKLRYAGVQRH